MDQHAGGPLTAEALLYYAGLLAGLGPRARPAADELAAVLAAAAAGGRTCIDRGGSLLFAVLAPGGRGLRALTHAGPAAAGVECWRRTDFLADRVERWEVETFVAEPAGAWERARAAAARAGAADTLARWHAALGPQGRLYAVGRADGADGPRAWVGWQLERTLPPDRALAAVGCAAAWPEAVALWEALLGAAPSPRRGPWSLTVRLGGAPRVRLGSTNWALRPEDDDKRRRLATVVGRLGGDRRFAEGLYKLIAGARTASRPRAVGRAVEADVTDGRLTLAEFYLGLP